ncbi:MAG: TatD family hydrolase [Candidatus Pacebacteria bacterium]|nr:TatD family hydrolase [Candidatus Paceibacterota bacterium]
MIFDTHAHVNFRAFDKDRDEVIKKCLDRGVSIINVGSNFETSKIAVNLANRYKNVYASVGLHPIHVDTSILRVKDEDEGIGEEPDFNYDAYKELAKDNKVIAIGEIGLDYYCRPKTKTKLAEFKSKQKEVLIKQIKLAEELDLPIIFHCRMAHDGLIEFLKQKNLKGVIHCFTGDLKQAKEYLDMGYYLGFNGIIFKLDLNEVIKETPTDRILLETDCPYLTPPEYITDRNDPIGVEYVAKRIAEIKNMDLNELIGKTNENAIKVFKLDRKE